jgi:1-acyl-sn-glycerol-3-phosphate acyltransferase
MRARNPIAVSRANSREDLLKVINEGVEKLKNGISVIIFPQSTRTMEFNPKKFNSLGVKLASKANVDVVPIAIKTDFWGNGKYVKDFGKIDRSKKIHIKFGEKITIEGNGKKEHNQIVEFISENLKKWSEEE